MTNQPKWNKVGTVGDINHVEYGGGLVFEDKTGVYAPEVEYYLGDNGAYLGKIRVYRFAIDQCTYIDGVLSDNCHHPEVPAWFAGYFDSEALISSLTSNDVMARAQAYTDIGLELGFDNLDDYPLYLTYNEAVKRVARK